MTCVGAGQWDRHNPTTGSVVWVVEAQNSTGKLAIDGSSQHPPRWTPRLGASLFYDVKRPDQAQL